LPNSRESDTYGGDPAKVTMTWLQSLRLAIGIYEHNRPAVGVVSADQLVTIWSISR
jgi:hypothetical protein